MCQFPTYTIPEAAVFLGISRFTLFEWFSGENQLLRPSGKVGGLPLLSFQDVTEAYAINMLRVYHRLSMQSIRLNLENIPRFASGDQPLISDLKVLEKSLLLERQRGQERHHIDLKHGQLVINEVADIFANRVAVNSAGRVTAIFPWRHWHSDTTSKPVEIDPEILTGRLVITGTRIPVNVIKGRSKTESIEAIAADYSIPVESVKKALMHVDKQAA